MSQPQVWTEIDLAAYRHNIRELVRRTEGGARFMAVVKADGYGHGARQLAAAALEEGASWLGVARPQEAVELRRQGLEAPILIFGYTPPEQVGELIDHGLTPAVFSLSMAQVLSERAQATGRRLRIHLKVDTGMGRLGLLATEPSITDCLGQIRSIASLPGLEIDGLFTHFATADSEDRTHVELQLQRFARLTAALESDGLDIPLRHAANSAALLNLPAAHLDMVRPGIATYGLQPSHHWRSTVELRPVLSWKTRVIQTKEVPAGFGVSYGSTYKTARPTTLATVAVGYADGLGRLLSSRGEMLVRGRRVPIVGRVCMDLTVLDVGAVPETAVGDEVVILGRQGDESLSAEEMATTLDTINYEIVTSIAARVPRIYIGEQA